tara:strand:+ start:341 stop:445 length:105 start_codon:yes stop_codon:yes gene_type:complete
MTKNRYSNDGNDYSGDYDFVSTPKPKKPTTLVED